MRIIIFFDLPMITKTDLAEYRNFRKFLIKNGFVMMQESVYSKLVLSGSSSQLLRTLINKNLPKSGLVQLMEVTERQYAEIEVLSGDQKSSVINNIDRVVQL